MITKYAFNIKNKQYLILDFFFILINCVYFFIEDNFYFNYFLPVSRYTIFNQLLRFIGNMFLIRGRLFQIDFFRNIFKNITMVRLSHKLFLKNIDNILNIFKFCQYSFITWAGNLISSKIR